MPALIRDRGQHSCLYLMYVHKCVEACVCLNVPLRTISSFFIRPFTSNHLPRGHKYGRGHSEFNTTGVRGNKKGQKNRRCVLRPIEHGTWVTNGELNHRTVRHGADNRYICILAFQFCLCMQCKFYVPCVGLSTAQTQIFDGTLKDSTACVDSIR
jgi:hypothetical protein